MCVLMVGSVVGRLWVSWVNSVLCSFILVCYLVVLMWVMVLNCLCEKFRLF